MSSTPNLARPVHYVSYGTPGGEFSKQCRAAIVTEVSVAEDNEGRDRDYVSVAVLNPTGLFFQTGLLEEGTAQSQDEATGDVYDTGEYRGGTFHFPEDCVHGA